MMMMNKFSTNIDLYSVFFAEHVKQQGDSAHDRVKQVLDLRG
jgi:hypothetical protein